MECRNILSTIHLVAVSSCFTNALGYSNYYSGLGGYYGGTTIASYPTYGLSYAPLLKTKIYKKHLALKKPALSCLTKPCLPCLTKPCLPCLTKPYYPYYNKPCLPCLSSYYTKPAACYKSSSCFKYPSCGPCPWASYAPKCLKHKALLSLCS